MSAFPAPFSEAFVSLYISKLDYRNTPEKDNSTDGIYGFTNGVNEAIFCFHDSRKQ
jgi:hypothetical protein